MDNSIVNNSMTVRLQQPTALLLISRCHIKLSPGEKSAHLSSPFFYCLFCVKTVYMFCVSIRVMASIDSIVTSVQLMTMTLSSTTHLVRQALDSAVICLSCKRCNFLVIVFLMFPAGLDVTVIQY